MRWEPSKFFVFRHKKVTITNLYACIFFSYLQTVFMALAIDDVYYFEARFNVREKFLCWNFIFISYCAFFMLRAYLAAIFYVSVMQRFRLRHEAKLV